MPLPDNGPVRRNLIVEDWDDANLETSYSFTGERAKEQTRLMAENRARFQGRVDDINQWHIDNAGRDRDRKLRDVARRLNRSDDGLRREVQQSAIADGASSSAALGLGEITTTVGSDDAKLLEE